MSLQKGKGIARGYIPRPKSKQNLRQVNITFPEDLFVRVRSLCEENQNHFSDQVKQLIEWGFESMEEER